MDGRAVATGLARARIAIGVVGVLAPGKAARIMGGRRAADGLATPFVRMVAVRDVALGLGTVIAIDRGAPVRGWLEGSALADTGDLVAALLGRDRMTPGAIKATVGVGAASTLL